LSRTGTIEKRASEKGPVVFWHVRKTAAARKHRSQAARNRHLGIPHGPLGMGTKHESRLKRFLSRRRSASIPGKAAVEPTASYVGAPKLRGRYCRKRTGTDNASDLRSSFVGPFRNMHEHAYGSCLCRDLRSRGLMPVSACFIAQSSSKTTPWNV